MFGCAVQRHRTGLRRKSFSSGISRLNKLGLKNNSFNLFDEDGRLYLFRYIFGERGHSKQVCTRKPNRRIIMQTYPVRFCKPAPRPSDYNSLHHSGDCRSPVPPRSGDSGPPTQSPCYTFLPKPRIGDRCSQVPRFGNWCSKKPRLGDQRLVLATFS